jgi:diaminopimelate epimerase
MKFEKWQALGNDYLIVEEAQLPFALSAARVRRLCDAHFGVGADGVLLLARSEDPRLVADLRIFNPDGSEAELSGNGAREAILYLRQRGWTAADAFAIGTVAGEIRPTITGEDTCRVDMGHAAVVSDDFPSGTRDGRGELRTPAGAWSFQHVSIGNPQCAIHVGSLSELQGLDLPTLGPPIEGHELFPKRTNVSWYTELAPDRIRARIFERGVGETLASGTGATGAAVAQHLRAGAAGDDSARGQSGAGGDSARGQSLATGGDSTDGRSITVELDGGELDVEIGDDLHINLTGWARPVYAGELGDRLLEELRETE